MDMREYQLQAQETDRSPSHEGEGLIVPLLGLAGEVGTLLADYKKKLRDRETYRLFKENVAEELGDILWYVANVATKFDLDLAEIARFNLKKTRDRWLQSERVGGVGNICCWTVSFHPMSNCLANSR
jgi:NTP pyrophosphatase (non-canonical NTP hydrolase)